MEGCENGEGVGGVLLRSEDCIEGQILCKTIYALICTNLR